MFRKNEIEHLTHDIEQIFKFNFLENFFFLFFFFLDEKNVFYIFFYLLSRAELSAGYRDI